ncbi:MAG: DUF4115 domain-containing protein [Deltaproteobacteria bacterium]|nr:DUF4115 domain-containing protein [Deltaproteobacteria bacterium]
MTKDKDVVTSGGASKADTRLNLKAAREAKGLSLRDIFQQTRISVTNLEALEALDFRRLPAPVYTRTFIKSYASIVGLDVGELLGHYDRYIELQKAPVQPREREAGKSLVGFVFKQRRHLLSIVFLLVLLSLILFTALFHQSDDDLLHKPLNVPVTQEQKEPVEAATETAPVQEASPGIGTDAVVGTPGSVAQHAASLPGSTTGSKTMEALPAAQGNVPSPDAPPLSASYHLSIEAREVTWLKIQADGETPYEVLLRPGEKIDRKASASFAIDVGNAGGVDLFFQGKSLGSLGKTGEVVHLKLP